MKNKLIDESYKRLKCYIEEFSYLSYLNLEDRKFEGLEEAGPFITIVGEVGLSKFLFDDRGPGLPCTFRHVNTGGCGGVTLP